MEVFVKVKANIFCKKNCTKSVLILYVKCGERFLSNLWCMFVDTHCNMPKEQLDDIQINWQDTFKQLFDVVATKLHLMRSEYMICIYNTATMGDLK